MICPLFPGGTKYAASCLDGAPNPDLARSEFGPCPDCPVDFGPWGAWRAVGREVSWRAEIISEMAREYDTDRLNLGPRFVSLGMYIEIRIYLDASGWSP